MQMHTTTVHTAKISVIRVGNLQSQGSWLNQAIRVAFVIHRFDEGIQLRVNTTRPYFFREQFHALPWSDVGGNIPI
jgi:hypothetical protein